MLVPRRGHLQGLLEEHESLLGGAERERTLTGSRQPVSGANGDEVGLSSFWNGPISLDVVGGNKPAELFVLKRLEMVSHGQVFGPAIPPRQCCRGDFSDQTLHEAELASLGGAWVGVEGKKLLPDEVPEMRLERRRGPLRATPPGTRWRTCRPGRRRPVGAIVVLSTRRRGARR